MGGNGNRSRAKTADKSEAGDGANVQAGATLETREIVTTGLVCTIEVPLGEAREGEYKPRHVEVQLTSRQGATLNRVFEAITGKALSTKRTVSSRNHVLPWLLDGIADALEAAGQTEPTE